MRPLHETAGHGTYDLTECKVHCFVENGKKRIVAFVPKSSKVQSRRKQPVVNGKEVDLSHHLVTAWDEVTIYQEK
jgi:hypothetical protein